MEALKAVFLCFFFLSILRTSATPDTFTPTQSIRDGETLVSAGRRFELGFFSRGNSTRRYLGIWYLMSTETVVWVANRGTPLNNRLGVLEVTDKGVLVLLNSTKSIVWSSNTSRTAENPIAQLLDSGNLVVKDGNGNNPEKFLWQSFDYPCDTFLPEMKLGRNLVTGLDRFMSSWKSTEDPDQGEFSIRLDPRGLPQVVVMKGAKIKARSGSWNGRSLNSRLNPPFEIVFVMNESEVYFEYKLQNSLVFTRYVLNPSGIAQRFTWIDRTHSWELFSTLPADKCDNYAFCGEYASCKVNDPICTCLEGFVPKSPKDWSPVDLSDGCVRRTPLDCNSGYGFLKYTGLNLPDTSSSWFNKTISLEQCERLCMKNCSCSAYANLDIRGGGSGCLLWFSDLIDMRVLGEGGQDLYIRMATSELVMPRKLVCGGCGGVEPCCFIQFICTPFPIQTIAKIIAFFSSIILGEMEVLLQFEELYSK